MTLLLLLALATTAPRPVQDPGPGLEAQAPAPSAEVERKADVPEAAEPDEELPVSIARIQRKLARPPMMRVESGRAVYRVEVLGRKPTIEDILGPDYLAGPTPAGAPSHQEFLDLVTPEGVRGYAAFSNKEAFVVAATSFALKWALQRAIHKFENAKADRDREAARKEVEEALKELDRARERAGLAPR